MRKRSAFTLAIATLAGAAGAAVPTVAGATGAPRCTQQSASAERLNVIGLTADAKLVCFREHRPERARSIGAISGLSGDTELVGIDHRPATGELYGLGDAGGVYVLNTTTAAAVKKAQLNVALQGTMFDVDFNPTVDRLRVVSDTGQNLRVNVADGSTTADASLNVSGATATGVTGAAYTNNDADATTATTLFDLDTTNDQIVVQSPPNNGTLVATGKLGIDATGDAGFDVFSATQAGSTVRNRAFASITSGGATAFTSVDLLTGRATVRGWFAGTVTDIAIPLA